MIKKIVLGLLVLSPLSMIACSSDDKDQKEVQQVETVVPTLKATHNHYPVAHKYRLSTPIVENIDGIYTTIDLIDKPDSIELPTSVLFSDKVGAATTLSDLLKLTKNTLDVDYKFNSDFKVTTSNLKWKFEGDKLISHDDNPSDITIEYKGLTATTKAYYGSLDSVVMKNGDFSKWDVSKIATPSVWGTTTTLSLEKTPDGIDATKVHMDDVQEASGGLKAYGYMAHMSGLATPISLTPYANYIALKVYVTKSMLDTPIWFRTYWKTSTGVSNAIESDSKTFDHEGWYLIQSKINKSLKWEGTAVLDTIKLIQLASDAPAKSGDLYLEKIYESYEKMTSSLDTKTEIIN